MIWMGVAGPKDFVAILKRLPIRNQRLTPRFKRSLVAISARNLLAFDHQLADSCRNPPDLASGRMGRRSAISGQLKQRNATCDEPHMLSWDTAKQWVPDYELPDLWAITTSRFCLTRNRRAVASAWESLSRDPHHSNICTEKPPRSTPGSPSPVSCFPPFPAPPFPATPSLRYPPPSFAPHAHHTPKPFLATMKSAQFLALGASIV